MARTVLDKEWKDWIRLNVERGCSKDELLGILVKEGFAHEAARRELNPLAVPNLTRVLELLASTSRCESVSGPSPACLATGARIAR